MQFDVERAAHAITRGLRILDPDQFDTEETHEPSRLMGVYLAEQVVKNAFIGESEMPNEILNPVENCVVRSLQKQDPVEFTDAGDNGGDLRANALAKGIVSDLVQHGQLPSHQPTFNHVVPREQRVEQFIENCTNIVSYWQETAETPAEAAQGVMGSVLTMLDGGGDIPPMDMVPCVMAEQVAEYNDQSLAGWPAEAINNDVELHSMYVDRMRTLLQQRAADELSS